MLSARELFPLLYCPLLSLLSSFLRWEHLLVSVLVGLAMNKSTDDAALGSDDMFSDFGIPSHCDQIANNLSIVYLFPKYFFVGQSL